MKIMSIVYELMYSRSLFELAACWHQNKANLQECYEWGISQFEWFKAIEIALLSKFQSI